MGFRLLNTPVAVTLIIAGTLLLIYACSVLVQLSGMTSEVHGVGNVTVRSGNTGPGICFGLFIAVFAVWLILAGVIGSPRPSRMASMSPPTE